MAESSEKMVDENSGSVLGKRKTVAADTATELYAKILKQVEFYFSDSNLPRDKFLSSLSQKNDGWVSIATIGSFKRMRDLTEEIAVIVAALRTSPELLVVDEKGENVRRSRPLPTTEEIEAQKLRTIKFGYYPRENADLDSVTEFFQKFGKTNSVRLMRRDGEFQGAGFVEFSTEEECKKLIENPPKFKDTDEKPVKVQSHADWVADRQKQRNNKKSAAKNEDGANEDASNAAEPEKPAVEGKKGMTFDKDRVFEMSNLPAECTFHDIKAALGESLFPDAVQGGKSFFYVGLADSNVSKKPKTAEAPAAPQAPAATSENPSEEMKTDESKTEETPSSKEEAPAAESAEASTKIATVRLYEKSAHSAIECIALLKEKDVKICGVSPETRLVTGDEEAEHWRAYFDRRQDYRSGGGRGGRGGRGRGRGGRGRGRGRGGQKRRRF